MKRWLAGLVVVGALAVAAFAVNLSTPADAQDRTAERVSILETQVADQAADISSLRKRVRALEDAAKGTTGEEPDQPSGSAPTLSGTGETVSDKFTLQGGRYKVSATVDVDDFDGFAVTVYGPGDGDQELLFNEIIDSSGPWTGSAVFDSQGGGTFYVEVSNTSSPWTLTFEKL